MMEYLNSDKYEFKSFDHQQLSQHGQREATTKA
jgi:hypothetical protein